MTSAAVVGVFGKHRERRDFVRWGAEGELSACLEAWLGAELGRAMGRAGALPDVAIRFALRRRGCSRILMGTWVESCDALGRRFPLIGYAEVEVPTGGRVALASMASARFDAAMEVLLRGTFAAALDSGIGEILAPCEAEWEVAEARLGRYVRGLTVRGWGERVFGGFAALMPSAIDSASKLANAARRSVGRPVSARFVGGDLRDLALWMGVFGSDLTEWGAWLALWVESGDVCVLGLEEPQVDLLAALWPVAGGRARTWRFDPAYVQDLGAEARAALERPLSEVLAELAPASAGPVRDRGRGSKGLRTPWGVPGG